MKRALFTLIAWIAVVPSAYANFVSFEVMEGYLTRSGSPSTGLSQWQLFLSGNGFQAFASGETGGCPSTFRVGNPITHCGIFFRGHGSILLGCIAQEINFDDTFNIFGGAPMFVSGATHAVLTQPLSFGGYLAPCTSLPTCQPYQTTYSLSMNGLVGSYSIELLLNQRGDEYDILEETFTFHRVPEASTLALMAVGLLGTLFYRQRNRAQSARTSLGSTAPAVSK